MMMLMTVLMAPSNMNVTLQLVYKSVSAFAPISHPTECPWGHKAFSGYLGENKESWKVKEGL